MGANFNGNKVYRSQIKSDMERTVVHNNGFQKVKIETKTKTKTHRA